MYNLHIFIFFTFKNIYLQLNELLATKDLRTTQTLFRVHYSIAHFTRLLNALT